MQELLPLKMCSTAVIAAAAICIRGLAALMDAGQDKNSAIYRAAVPIQSRVR